MKKKSSLGKILIILALLLYTVFLFFPIVTVLITAYFSADESAAQAPKVEF